MNKRTLQLLTIGFLLTGLIGCAGVSQNEYDTLKAENEKLKKEIEDLKYGPDKLLNQAKVYIDNKDFQKAKTEFQNLLSKHPASPQSTEAKQLIIIAENGINEQKNADEKLKIEQEVVEKERLVAADKANAEKVKEEKERLAKATIKMNKKYDDINEVTWYRDITSPNYVIYNGFFVVIGQSKGSKPWLILVIQYAADNWLFIESYTIKVDGKTYTISENSYGEIKRDSGSLGIREWLNRQVGATEYEIIKAVAYGKDAKIRFSGKDYREDKTITEQQKLALRNVLDTYTALGGDGAF